jgi:hypothetical protein
MYLESFTCPRFQTIHPLSGQNPLLSVFKVQFLWLGFRHVYYSTRRDLKIERRLTHV